MSFAYFNKLNYTLGNEDTCLEFQMLKDNVGHVMSVCGSGGRVVPLLARHPKKVSFVDLSKEQLWLAELRVAAIRAFDYGEFLGFLGYPPEPFSPAQRRQSFGRLELSSQAREFFETAFTSHQWESLLYEGRWERTFAKMSQVARLFTGDKGLGLFECETLDQQKSYLDEEFPMKRWYAAVGLMGNAHVFNALLYKGHFPEKNIPDSYFAFYKNAFHRLFAQGLARENFFLQILFFGRIRYAEGNPIECDRKIFARMKEALDRVEVHYILGNIVEEARKASTSVDFLSLSDVPSYFSGHTEKDFMQRLRPALSDGAEVIVRSYLHVPWRPDLTGYENVTRNYEQPINREKTQMYLVDAYRKVG